MESKSPRYRRGVIIKIKTSSKIALITLIILGTTVVQFARAEVRPLQGPWYGFWRLSYAEKGILEIEMRNEGEEIEMWSHRFKGESEHETLVRLEYSFCGGPPWN